MSSLEATQQLNVLKGEVLQVAQRRLAQAQAIGLASYHTRVSLLYSKDLSHTFRKSIVCQSRCPSVVSHELGAALQGMMASLPSLPLPG